MDTETKRELADRGFSLISTLARQAWEMRSRQQRREKDLEWEKEIAEVKARAEAEAALEAASDAGDDLPATTTDAGAGGGGIDAGIGSLAEQQDCGICAALLAEVRSVDDPERKAQALTEYGRFIELVEAGAPNERIDGFINQSGVLEDLLERARAD